jgi:hypothetical protein
LHSLIHDDTVKYLDARIEPCAPGRIGAGVYYFFRGDILVSEKTSEDQITLRTGEVCKRAQLFRGDILVPEKTSEDH